MSLFNELQESYSYIQFATCISDQNGNCLQTNAKWQEVTGLPKKESLGLGWLQNIHTDDKEALLEELEIFRTSNKDGLFNYRIIVDGKEKHIQKLSTPVIIDNELVYFVCIITDVTIQKEQEKQLDKQNKLLHALQEIQIGFLTSTDESQIFEDLLHKILHLTNCQFGFITEVIVENGKPILLSHAISDLSWSTATKKMYDSRKNNGMRFENMDTLFGAAIKSGEPVISMNIVDDERSHGFPKGHPHLDNFLGIPVKNGTQTIGLMGLANNKEGFSQETVTFLEPITATVSTLIQAYQIKKEKQLADKGNVEKAQYLNILLSSLDDIIFELNENLEFTNVWTQDISKLFVPPEQFLGKRFSDFFPPEFCQMVEPVMREVLATGITSGYEYKGFGEMADRWYSGTDSMVTLSNGEKRLLKQVRDITAIKNSQQAILNAKDEAEKATRIKSEFISVMSHEIRTPMNAIIGFINLLLDENPQPSQLTYLNNLQVSASQLLYLLNNILDYSKLEAGKMQLEMAPVSLSEMVENIEKTFSQSALDKNIQLITEVDTHIPEKVTTDLFRLNRILTNLVSNAIKFTHQGKVTIALKQLNQTNTIASIQFAITDTGVGISESNLQYIFEEFTQEHSSITRKYGGTGLGLAITHKLIKEFGSTIKVVSKKDEGSTFTFTLELPIAKQSSASIEEKLATNSTLNDIHILVVEDNMINAMIVQKFITNWGGKSQHAIGGFKAIEMARLNTFDAILMDLQMPEMDGFETTKHIRSFLPNIPIIALTADAMSETKTQVLACGMTDYVTKPFNPQELKGILEHYGKAKNKKANNN